jgi:hypothetical protein
MNGTNNSNMKPMSQKVGRSYIIDGGMGKIHYQTGSIPLQLLMEAIEEKLRTKSPNEITSAIERL